MEPNPSPAPAPSPPVESASTSIPFVQTVWVKTVASVPALAESSAPAPEPSPAPAPSPPEESSSISIPPQQPLGLESAPQSPAESSDPAPATSPAPPPQTQESSTEEVETLWPVEFPRWQPLPPPPSKKTVVISQPPPSRRREALPPTIPRNSELFKIAEELRGARPSVRLPSRGSALDIPKREPEPAPTGNGKLIAAALLFILAGGVAFYYNHNPSPTPAVLSSTVESAQTPGSPSSAGSVGNASGTSGSLSSEGARSILNNKLRPKDWLRNFRANNKKAPEFSIVSKFLAGVGDEPLTVDVLLFCQLDKQTEERWRREGLFKAPDSPNGLPYIRTLTLDKNNADNLWDWRIEGVALKAAADKLR